MSTYVHVRRSPLAAPRPPRRLDEGQRRVARTVGAALAAWRPDSTLETVEREFGPLGIDRRPLRPFDCEWESFRLLGR